MLSFDRILSATERKLVEDYLAKKWQGAVIHGTVPFDPGLRISFAEGTVLDLNGLSGTIGELAGRGTLANTSGEHLQLTVQNGKTFKGQTVGDIDLHLRGLGMSVIIR